MKINIRILATISLSLFFAFHSVGQNGRDVYWMHGFNGDETRWQGYAQRFGGPGGERQMDSSTPSFETSGRISTITNHVSNQMGPSLPDNMGIGGSLGGVVLRNLEVAGGDELGGLITIHSPNKGASIARSVNTGAVQVYLTNLVTTLGTALDEMNDHLSAEIDFINGITNLWNAFAQQISNLLSLVGLFEIDMQLDGLEIPTSEELENQLSAVFQMLYSPLLQDIYDDLDPTKSFIQGLNSFPSALPRIEVHGHETDKEPFRMGCSMTEKVWEKPLAETTPYPDDCLLDEKAKAESSLQTAQDWLNVKGSIAILGAWTPWTYKVPGRLFDAAQKVKKAKDLVKNGIEHGWEDLIGTLWEVDETITVTQMTPACSDQLEDLEEELQNLDVDQHDPAAAILLQQIADLKNDPDCYEEVTRTTYVPVDNSDAPYDGLILEAEQTTGGADLELQNMDVNHVEMNNHPNMWINFNLIFDSPAPNFFRTEPR